MESVKRLYLIMEEKRSLLYQLDRMNNHIPFIHFIYMWRQLNEATNNWSTAYEQWYDQSSCEYIELMDIWMEENKSKV